MPPASHHQTAEAEKYRAEAVQALAEAEHAAALARKEAAQAEIAEITLRGKRREERNELAKDQHHKVYVFDREVSEASVKACIQQLTLWSRQDPGCNIEIQINSPGGSIFDGFALIDFLRDLRGHGHRITAVGLGIVASMAGVILQAADVRIMGANAMLLIHEGSLGAVGDFGKVEDRVKLMNLMHDRILELFEERARAINPRVTKAWIRNRWTRKDWWMTAADAAKYGFADSVR